MVYLSSPEEFLSESRLLLAARPLTARVTTTYTLPRTKPSKSQTKPSTNTTKITKEGPEPATLVLKTFDPVSGTCLKYKTRKATELGRLLGALRTSAGVLAGVKLDEPSAATTTGQGQVEEKGEVKGEAASSTATATQSGQGQSQGAATGQGQGQGAEKAKKKKKGKK